MNSLVDALLNQHPNELIPLRCNKKMVGRLNNYFEEAVLENALPALFIQSRCPQGSIGGELRRYHKLTSVARHLVLFTCDSSCTRKQWSYPILLNVTRFESKFHHAIEDEGFTIILDNRFSAVQAFERVEGSENNGDAVYRTVWSFEPNVIYSALQYLMARTQALHPDRVEQFNRLIRESTPRITSVYLTLSIMTKFARVLQAQTEHAHAINHLSNTIRSSLGLSNVLQTAVDAIGRTLNARRCALWLWQVEDEPLNNLSEYHQPGTASINQEDFCLPRPLLSTQLKNSKVPLIVDSDNPASRFTTGNVNLLPLMAVPVIYHDIVIGAIGVEDGDANRNWDEDEVRLIETIADQIAVAVNHARLFEKIQASAMTDGLTGVSNRRHFETQFEHEFRLCQRSSMPLSLIMVDLDYLKKINDTYGHPAGDSAIQHIAHAMKGIMRTTDTIARYGGEEFVVILPHTDLEGALQVAERIRHDVASKLIPDVGHVTASLGVATFPLHTRVKEELLSVADQALYRAKTGGRNRVCAPDNSIPPASAAPPPPVVFS